MQIVFHQQEINRTLFMVIFCFWHSYLHLGRNKNRPRKLRRRQEYAIPYGHFIISPTATRLIRVVLVKASPCCSRARFQFKYTCIIDWVMKFKANFRKQYCLLSENIASLSLQASPHISHCCFIKIPFPSNFIQRRLHLLSIGQLEQIGVSSCQELTYFPPALCQSKLPVWLTLDVFARKQRVHDQRITASVARCLFAQRVRPKKVRRKHLVARPTIS